MTGTKKIIIAASLVATILILVNFTTIKAAVTGVKQLKQDVDFIRVQNEIYQLIVYYATPRGAQTGVGKGVDLFQMTDDYGKDGVKSFIYVTACKWCNVSQTRYDYKQFDFSILDEWYGKGIYEEYVKAKRNNSGMQAVLNYAVKIIPIAVSIAVPPAAPIALTSGGVLNTLTT